MSSTWRPLTLSAVLVRGVSASHTEEELAVSLKTDMHVLKDLAAVLLRVYPGKRAHAILKICLHIHSSPSVNIPTGNGRCLSQMNEKQTMMQVRCQEAEHLSLGNPNLKSRTFWTSTEHLTSLCFVFFKLWMLTNVLCADTQESKNLSCLKRLRQQSQPVAFDSRKNVLYTHANSQNVHAWWVFCWRVQRLGNVEKAAL